MGTQNGSKLEICPERSLIHALGSHAFAMFSAHALHEGRGYART